MARIWYCVQCGYEVERGGKCHNCKAPLTASPLTELAEGEVDDELGYRLNDWEDEDRGQLIEALVNAGTRHRFEGDELVVSATDEEQVDLLMTDVSRRSMHDDGSGEAIPDVTPLSHEPPDPAMVEAVTALHDAARRLRGDPTDMVADTDVAEASATMFALNLVYGVDADTWAAIGRVTRRLLGALGAEVALENEISDQAAILCRLLDPLIEAEANDDGQPSADPESVHTDNHDDEEETDELVYELDDWLPEERTHLSLLLERDDVRHEWERFDLVVPAAEQENVEVLFDEVGRPGSDELSAAEEDLRYDDETDYMAVSELFGAADRLAGDPDNKNRRKDLVAAAEVIADWTTPIGMTDEQWWRIKGQARALRVSIQDDASGFVVADLAIGLRDVLREFV